MVKVLVLVALMLAVTVSDDPDTMINCQSNSTWATPSGVRACAIESE